MRYNDAEVDSLSMRRARSGESPVGEVCAIPIDRFPFSCFTCLEEIVGESEMRFSEEFGI